MKFTKMHGIGNDYVHVDCFSQPVTNPSHLAPIVSNRHTGIGADGLILMLPSDKADVRMRIFNADGSEAEMCGNGIRCVAKYVYENGLSRNNPVSVETGNGVLSISLQIDQQDKVRFATVNMASPILELRKIPVDRDKVTTGQRKHEYRIRLAQVDVFLDAVFVSMGNPHAVFYTDDVTKIELHRLGPLIENHPAFTHRINAHFVQIINPGEVIMRTWERGSGVTLACGTGACAVAVAGVLTNRTNRQLLAHLPGGDLQLNWRDSDNNVYMTGPAAEVFKGEWLAC